MAQRAALAVLVAVLAVLAASPLAHASSFVNTRVEQHVDLSGHNVVWSARVTARRAGSDASQEYVVCVPAAYGGKVAHVRAVADDALSTVLPVTVPLAAASVGCSGGASAAFGVDVSGAATDGSDAVAMEVEVHLVHVQRPLPTGITQEEEQRVVFEGDAVWLSPYTTEWQTCSFQLASSGVESFTDGPLVKHSRDKIVYGPYESVAPGESVPVRLHYANSNPFVTVDSVERDVEVSLWGTVAVEEHYAVRNTGATLLGGFSRLDYTMKMMIGSSFRRLVCALPPAATGLYYRDVIGNISTSAVINGADYKELELKTRFPVFGGWRTEWYQGYTVPLREVVTADESGRQVLTLPMGPTLTESAVNEVVVKVVLPEGASQVEVSAPWQSTVTQGDQRRVTYLDTVWSGRPVVTLRSTGPYVDAKQAPLRVSFTMPHPLYMLREPLLLITAIFAVLGGHALLSHAWSAGNGQ